MAAVRLNFARKIHLSGHASTPARVSLNVAQRRNRDKVSHPVPAKTASVPPQVGQVKASNGKAYSHFFASVPVVPLKKQGRGKEGMKIGRAKLMQQTVLAE